MFWKYKLEKLNSLHPPNHGSYLLGLAHLTAPDMLWHLPSSKQTLPGALVLPLTPTSLLPWSKVPGELSSLCCLQPRSLLYSLLTGCPALPWNLRPATGEQQMPSLADAFICIWCAWLQFLLKAFSSVGFRDTSLLVFLRLTGCSFPGSFTGSFSGVSEPCSHILGALVFSGSWAIGSRLRAKTPG